jgi:hypothetical protein
MKNGGSGKSPNQELTHQNNNHLKEQGKPLPGFPNPRTEKPPHGEAIKSPERQPPQRVWDILERQVRLWSPGRPRMKQEVE